MIEMKEFTMTSILYSPSQYLSRAKLVTLDQKPEGKIFRERNKYITASEVRFLGDAAKV